MKFTKALIIVSDREDEISLYCEGLTHSHPRMEYYPIFKVKCEQGYGETWLKENFPEVSYIIVEL